MSERRNTLPGYDVAAAAPIPDEIDPACGFQAGDTVTVLGYSEDEPEKDGVAQAIMEGQGTYQGHIVADVLIENDEHEHGEILRVPLDMLRVPE